MKSKTDDLDTAIAEVSAKKERVESELEALKKERAEETQNATAKIADLGKLIETLEQSKAKIVSDSASRVSELERRVDFLQTRVDSAKDKYVSPCPLVNCTCSCSRLKIKLFEQSYWRNKIVNYSSKKLIHRYRLALYLL